MANLEQLWAARGAAEKKLLSQVLLLLPWNKPEAVKNHILSLIWQLVRQSISAPLWSTSLIAGNDAGEIFLCIKLLSPLIRKLWHMTRAFTDGNRKLYRIIHLMPFLAFSTNVFTLICTFPAGGYIQQSSYVGQNFGAMHKKTSRFLQDNSQVYTKAITT